MNRGRSIVGLVALVAWASVVGAAEKPPEAYAKAMKDIGAATGALTKAAKAEDFATVSKSAIAIVEVAPGIRKFWEGKADDAVAAAAAMLKAAGDLRVAADLSSADGIAFSTEELTAACAKCHTAHRERLADGTFEIK